MQPNSSDKPGTLGKRAEPGLVRALGPRIATAMVVGTVIGSGIFFKPGNIAGAVGHFPTILSVWVFGGALCILGALCFSELATMFPEAGGLYVYLRETYGSFVAFLFGWCEFLFAKPAAIGALSVAFVGSLSLAFFSDESGQGGLSTMAKVVCVSGLVLSLSLVNIIGVIWGGRLQMGITILKATNLALVAILPFLFFVLGHQTISIQNYTTTVVPQEAGFSSQVGAALLAVMWAYHGWHGITPLAEEVRDPQRTLPLALFAGIGILILLYISANLAYHAVLPMDRLAAAGDHGAEEVLKQVLGTVFGSEMGRRGAAIMSLVIMCSTFGAISSNLLEAPRVSFAMGRDDVFFRSLGRVHPQFRTPAIAIAVTALMSIGVVAGAGLAKSLVRNVAVDEPVKSSANAATASAAADSAAASPAKTSLLRDFGMSVLRNLQQGSLFTLLTNFVVFASNVFYTLGVLAVIVLRRREPDRPRTYRTWGYPWVPITYLVISAWFLFQIFRSNPLEALSGVGLIAIGVPVYWMFPGRRAKAVPSDAGG